MEFASYLENYVFDLFPLWSQEPETNTSFPVEKLVGLGVDFQSLYIDYSMYSAKNKYVFKNRSAITELNDFFNLMLGRYGSFWLPSWKKDIVLTANIGASDTEINIEDIDYSIYYPSSPGTGRHLFFHLGGRQGIIKKVTDVPSSTQLTIDSSFGQNIDSSTKVSFLYYVRFDIDEIEWEYITPTVAETTLFFKEIPNEYPI